MAKRILPKLQVAIAFGVKFGRLTVVIEEPRRKGRGESYWLCRCECGGEKVVSSGSLKNQDTRSCGCLQRERTAESHCKHGGADSPEYVAWMQMKARCLNRNAPHYEYYGGRGIAVCDRWLGDNGFANFLADMGPKPSPEHSVERKDNGGNYTPANCVWATRLTQANNRRNNRRLTWRGETRTVAEWSRETGIAAVVITMRLNRLGWDVERALTTPARRKRSNA